MARVKISTAQARVLQGNPNRATFGSWYDFRRYCRWLHMHGIKHNRLNAIYYRGALRRAACEFCR